MLPCGGTETAIVRRDNETIEGRYGVIAGEEHEMVVL